MTLELVLMLVLSVGFIVAAYYRLKRKKYIQILVTGILFLLIMLALFGKHQQALIMDIYDATIIEVSYLDEEIIEYESNELLMGVNSVEIHNFNSNNYSKDYKELMTLGFYEGDRFISDVVVLSRSTNLSEVSRDDLKGMILVSNGHVLRYNTEFYDNLYALITKKLKAEEVVSELIDTTNLGVVHEICLIDEWVYYINKEDHAYIYKTNETEDIKVLDHSAFGLYEYEGQIYYINMNDDYHVYTLNPDTGETVCIIDKSVQKINIEHGLIYYMFANNGYIYRTNLMGEDPVLVLDDYCLDFSVEDKGIYYLHRQKDYRGLYLSRYDMKSDYIENVIEQSINAADVNQEWIYYSVHDEGIYKVRHDGSEETKISDVSPYYLKVINDVIYCMLDGEDHGFYRCDAKGNVDQLSEDTFPWVDIYDNWLIFRGFESGESTWVEIVDSHQMDDWVLERLKFK